MTSLSWTVVDTLAGLLTGRCQGIESRLDGYIFEGFHGLFDPGYRILKPSEQLGVDGCSRLYSCQMSRPPEFSGGGDIHSIE